MTQEIKLKRKDLGSLLKQYFPDYKGRKITLRIKDEYRIHSSSLFWDSGSKTKFVAFDMQGNQINTANTSYLNPITANHDYIHFNVPSEMMILELQYFGMSKFLNVYVSSNSDWLPKFLNGANLND